MYFRSYCGKRPQLCLAGRTCTNGCRLLQRQCCLSWYIYHLLYWIDKFPPFAENIRKPSSRTLVEEMSLPETSLQYRPS